MKIYRCCLYYIQLSNCRSNHNRRIWNKNKHWDFPSWGWLLHPPFSWTRFNPSSLIILSSILLPREIPPLPLCHRPRETDRGMWRVAYWDFLHLLAPWARGLDSLPHLKVRNPIILNIFNVKAWFSSQERSYPAVKHSHLKFLVISIPLFSQERIYHASVVIQDTIILVGGSRSSTGEIVKSK